MSNALIVLLALGLVVAFWALDQGTRRAAERTRVWLELIFPKDTASGQIAAVLSAISGRRSEVLCFELVSTAEGLTHRIGLSTAMRDFVETQLRTAILGIRITPIDPPIRRATTIMELATSHAMRPLRIIDPEAFSASLHASLVVSGREELGMQWLIRPGGSRTGYSSVAAAWRHLVGSPPPPSAGDLRAAKEKQTSPLFQGVLRLSAVSSTVRRSNALLARPMSVLASVRTPQVRLRRRWSPAAIARHNLLRVALPLIWPVSVSTQELADGLLGAPLGSPNVVGLTQEASPQLPPHRDQPERGLLVGLATHPGFADQPVALDLDSLRTHGLLLGGTGSGKSTLAEHLVLQQIRAGSGGCFIEPKRDSTRSIVQRLTLEEAENLVIIDASDYGRRPVVGQNLLDGPPGEHDLITDQIVGMFLARHGANFGPRSQWLLTGGVRTVLTDPTGTLVDVARLFSSPRERARRVATLTDRKLIEFWQTFESWSPAEQANATAPLINKLDQIVMKRAVAAIVGQPSTISFDDIVRQRKFLLVSLAATSIGEEAAAFLGGMTLSRLVAAVMRQDRLPTGQRPTFFLTIDEAPTMAAPPTPLEAMLTLGRSAGLSVLLLGQSSQQFNPRQLAIMQANCKTKMVYATSGRDAPALAREFGPTVTAEALQALDRYELILATHTDGRRLNPVTVRTLPPDPVLGFEDQIRDRSAARYGRDPTELATNNDDLPDLPGPIGRRTTS